MTAVSASSPRPASTAPQASSHGAQHVGAASEQPAPAGQTPVAKPEARKPATGKTLARMAFEQHVLGSLLKAEEDKAYAKKLEKTAAKSIEAGRQLAAGKRDGESGDVVGTGQSLATKVLAALGI